MKLTAKIISLLLAALFCLTLFSCGSGTRQNSPAAGNETGNGGKQESSEDLPGADKVWYIGGEALFNESLDGEEVFGDRPDTIDPEAIYASVEFTESMLHGIYVLNNIDKDEEILREKLPFIEKEFEDGPHNVSAVPVAVFFGSDKICNSVDGYKFSDYEEVADGEVAVIKLLTEKGAGYFVALYEIDGDELVFSGIDKTSVDDEPFAYRETGEVFRYGFKIRGPYLTFSNGDTSLTLTAYCMTENNTSELDMSGYSTIDTPLIDELDYFNAGRFNYAVKMDGSYYANSIFKLDGEGRLSMYLKQYSSESDKEDFYGQYAYIVQSDAGFLTDFGVILLDGEKVYDYSDSISAREARILEDSGVEVDDIEEEQIKEIAEKTTDLYDDLTAEFEERGIAVTINRRTGEIVMDASVLFGGDSAEITEEGKELLDNFIAAYAAIVYSDKYDGFISKTLVEGHIAPIAGSTYESGLPLSEERARNVKDYCVSADIGEDSSKLAESLESVGLSNTRPVYGADGEVDLDASRRVSFRFIVDTDSVD